MSVLLDLVKLRITIASATTTAVGYVMARGTLDWRLLSVAAGIFLQACGAAALNQVQESDVDARMRRTAGRPIPSGRIGRGAAAGIATALLAAGTALLWALSPPTAGLGLAAAAVYNGLYTPLKRHTPFAVLPGSLIGALPPAAGWVAAGGYLSDPTIQLVAFFFFLWQVPHFWLLLLAHRGDYAQGGLPSLFDRFDGRQVVRMTFVWIVAVALAAPLALLHASLHSPAAALIVAAAGLALILRARRLFRAVDRRAFKLRFMEINSFALLVMATLVVERLA